MYTYNQIKMVCVTQFLGSRLYSYHCFMRAMMKETKPIGLQY